VIFSFLSPSNLPTLTTVDCAAEGAVFLEIEELLLATTALPGFRWRGELI
jgi:hypothetical protein